MFVFLFLIIGLMMGDLSSSWAASRPMPVEGEGDPYSEGAYKEESYDDGYDEEGEEPMPETEEITEEMAVGPVDTAYGARKGFRVTSDRSGEVERLDNDAPPVEEKPWQAQAEVLYDGAIEPVIQRREHPPIQPELEFGQTDWNQIDLHSLTRKRIDRS